MKQVINWSPLHFLSALGAGGMVVTFFMFLLFWVPHPGQPVPVYSDWSLHFQTSGFVEQGIVVFSLLGIILFGLLHFSWLYLNFKEFRKY